MSNFKYLHKEIFKGPNVTPSSYTPSDLTLSKTNFNASQSQITNGKFTNTQQNSQKTYQKSQNQGYTLPVDLQMAESPFYIIKEEQEDVMKTINSSISNNNKNTIVDILMGKVQKKLQHGNNSQQQANFNCNNYNNKSYCVNYNYSKNNVNKTFQQNNNCDNIINQSKICKSFTPNKKKQKKMISITINTDLQTPSVQTPNVSQVEGTTQIQKKVIDDIQKNSSLKKRVRNNTVHDFKDYSKKREIFSHKEYQKSLNKLKQPQSTPSNIENKKTIINYDQNQQQSIKFQKYSKINYNTSNNNQKQKENNYNNNNCQNYEFLYNNLNKKITENKSQSIFSLEQSLDLKIEKAENLQQHQKEQNLKNDKKSILINNNSNSRQIGKIVKNIKNQQKQLEKLSEFNDSELKTHEDNSKSQNNSDNINNDLFDKYLKKTSLESINKQTKQKQQQLIFSSNVSEAQIEDSFQVTGSKNQVYQVDYSPFSVCKMDSDNDNENDKSQAVQQYQEIQQQQQIIENELQNLCVDEYSQLQEFQKFQYQQQQLQQDLLISNYKEENKIEDQQINATKIQQRVSSSPFLSKNQSNDFFLLKESPVKIQKKIQNNGQIINNTKLKTIKRQKSSLTLLRNHIQNNKTRVQSQEQKKNIDKNYNYLETKKRDKNNNDYSNADTKLKNSQNQDFVISQGVQLNFSSSGKQNQNSKIDQKNVINNNEDNVQLNFSKNKKSVFSNLFLETQSIIQNIHIGSSQNTNRNLINQQIKQRQDKSTQKKVSNNYNNVEKNKQNLNKKQDKSAITTAYNNQSYIMQKNINSNNTNHLKQMLANKRRKAMPQNNYYNFKQQVNPNIRNYRGISLDLKSNKSNNKNNNINTSLSNQGFNNNQKNQINRKSVTINKTGNKSVCIHINLCNSSSTQTTSGQDKLSSISCFSSNKNSNTIQQNFIVQNKIKKRKKSRSCSRNKQNSNSIIELNINV